jgi:hypothetical protein
MPDLQYKAVILNFDRRTVKYVPVDNVPAAKRTAIASSSGSTPPQPKKR